MHRKRADYAEFGVLEYLVLDLQRQQLHWFDLQRDEELRAANDGIMRMQTTPGLWIDAAAVLARDYHRMIAIVDEGLASGEHAAFVKKLAAHGCP
jgi:hypothetical protein